MIQLEVTPGADRTVVYFASQKSPAIERAVGSM